MYLFWCVVAPSTLIMDRLGYVAKLRYPVFYILCVGDHVFQCENDREKQGGRNSDETEQQHSAGEANDEFQPVAQCWIERIGLWPGALVCSHSLFPPAL